MSTESVAGKAKLFGETTATMHAGAPPEQEVAQAPAKPEAKVTHDKPYECPVCGRGYKHLKGVKDHIRDKHGSAALASRGKTKRQVKSEAKPNSQPEAEAKATSSTKHSRKPAAKDNKALLAELKQLHEDILEAARRTMERAIRAGEVIDHFWRKLKHGRKLAWAKKNLPFSVDTAERYLNCYRHREDPKFRRLRNLTDAYRYLIDRNQAEREWMAQDCAHEPSSMIGLARTMAVPSLPQEGKPSPELEAEPEPQTQAKLEPRQDSKANADKIGPKNANPTAGEAPGGDGSGAGEGEFDIERSVKRCTDAIVEEGEKCPGNYQDFLVERIFEALMAFPWFAEHIKTQIANHAARAKLAFDGVKKQ